MTVTWSDLVQIAIRAKKAKVQKVCNNQSGYTILPPEMDVLVEIDGCEPPEQIRVDKIGVFMTANYIQTQKMLYRIYSSMVSDPVSYTHVRLLQDYPSNEGLVF